MAGGTPNYAARLKHLPVLGRYVALLRWMVTAPATCDHPHRPNQDEPRTLGIACPETILKIGFTCVAFIVGLRYPLGCTYFRHPGDYIFTRFFCFQGLGWLAFSTTSPGLFPAHWSVSALENGQSGSSQPTLSTPVKQLPHLLLIADGPLKLRFLSFAAWLIPPVYLGGSWVLMQLATQPEMGDT